MYYTTRRGGKTVSLDDYAQVGSFIREHRKKARLSQRALADLAGVGKTVVFDIEKGKPTVRLQTLMRILGVLKS